MSEDCPACASLANDVVLPALRDFERFARLIDGRLDEGALIPNPDGDRHEMTTPNSYLEMRTQMKSDGGLPDAFTYFFRCVSCGCRYELSCEAYHGSGGAWRRIG